MSVWVLGAQTCRDLDYVQFANATQPATWNKTVGSHHHHAATHPTVAGAPTDTAAADDNPSNVLRQKQGAYDAAGDFAYRIGLPIKTGVGGGMVAIAPGVGTIAVWAPELDAKGNSVLGAFALERLVQLTGLSHTTF